MVKYIDSEAFFKVINTLSYKDTSYPDASVYNGAISDVADMLTHFPAADVQEVRHGKWEPYLNEGLIVKCSVCGSRYAEPWHYCPNCGAKMERSKE